MDGLIIPYWNIYHGFKQAERQILSAAAHRTGFHPRKPWLRPSPSMPT
jgi:hypothetical protein